MSADKDWKKEQDRKWTQEGIDTRDRKDVLDQALFDVEKRVYKLEWQIRILAYGASLMSGVIILVVAQELIKLGL